MDDLKSTAAIILAGGKGTRMKIKGQKVLSELNGKPIVSYVLERLKSVRIGQIIIVVGHRAPEVRSVLGPSYDYALQRKRLGTGHAVKVGLTAVKPGIKNVFVFNGDDSAYHTNETITEILSGQCEKNATLSFVTVIRRDTTRLGRIIRDKNGEVVAIREEKDCSPQESEIREVNDGCYLFNCEWLQKNIKKIKKSDSGEYYITQLCSAAIDQKATVLTYTVSEDEWVNISTTEDLERANEFIKHTSK